MQLRLCTCIYEKYERIRIGWRLWELKPKSGRSGAFPNMGKKLGDLAGRVLSALWDCV